MPRRHHRQLLTGLQAAVQVHDQAVRQRDQSRQLPDIGHSIEDADLHGPKMRRWPYVPTDFIDLINDSRGLLVVYKAFELTPGLELEGQSCGGQLLKHHRPVAGITGVLAGPVRGRRRQRQQVRVMVEQ